MTHSTPAHTVAKPRPALAALSPIWELIFISESLIGLFGGFASIGLSFLSALTSLTLALAELFGGPAET